MVASQSVRLPAERQVHLDSMRGIAACLVALTHFLAAFYPYSVFGSADDLQAHIWWEAIVLIPPFSLLTAGHFAVCLFFVLSGYVLSIRFIGESEQVHRIVGAIIKRPIRLAGVLLFSLAFAAVIYQTNGFYNTQVANLNGSNWFAAFWNNEFTVSEFGRKLLVGKAGSEYNPPLWTLKIELVGSFLVFGLLLVINRLHFFVRCTVLFLALIFFYGTFYDGFIWGMLLADTIKNTSKKTLSETVSLIGFFIVIMLAAMPYYALQAAPAVSAPVGDPINGSVAALLHEINPHVPMLSAVLLLSLVLYSTFLQKLLNRRWLLWLGDISYALYAMHLLLIGSVVAYLVISLTPQVGYGNATLIALVAYLAVLTIISHLVVKGIDEPSVKLANLSGRKVVALLSRLKPIRQSV